MKKAFWSSEKLLSITAIIVSACTLMVFSYQTNLIRKHQYTSVLPYLILGSYGTYSTKYGFFLSNDGIGPAIIESVSIIDKDGYSYPSLIDYVNTQISKKDSINYSYSDLLKGRLISQKQNIELISVKDGKESSGRRIYEILQPENVSIKIEYKSVYDEKWIITNSDDYPKKQ